MFDFFREMNDELHGIDSVKARKERLEKLEEKKVNRFIFSGKMKALIICVGLLYIFTSAGMIAYLKKSDDAILSILKYAAMSLIAIIVIISLIFGKKKGEIIALIGIILFVFSLFLSISLL